MGQLLEGKTVIITGAGGGIGLATALHLHDERARWSPPSTPRQACRS